MNKIKKLIESLEGKSLSSIELLNLINNKANLVTYPEIEKYKTLDELLGPHKAVIILYETKKNYGHWTAIFKLNKNTIEHFDSYGVMPDDELKWIDMKFRKVNNELYPMLSYLILKSKYNITYNHHKFQQYKNNINTCGRWVALRLIFRELKLKDFIQIFKQQNKLSPDFYATLLTFFV